MILESGYLPIPHSISFSLTINTNYIALHIFYRKIHKYIYTKMADSTKSELKSAALMDQMKLHLSTEAGKQITKKINLVYQINIAPKKLGFNEESFVVDLKKGEVTKGTYEGGKPDATFSFKDDDFIKVATGKMNPQIAFMRGAMKIKGSISAAQKFTPDIFPKPSKM